MPERLSIASTVTDLYPGSHDLESIASLRVWDI